MSNANEWGTQPVPVQELVETIEALRRVAGSLAKSDNPAWVVTLRRDAYEKLCKAHRQSIPGRQPRRKGVWKMKRQ